MEQQFIIRPARAKDIDAIWTMFTAVHQQLVADHIPIWNDGYPAREDFELDIRENAMLVAERDGELLGSISHSPKWIDEYFFDAKSPAEAHAAFQKLMDFCGFSTENTVSAHRLMVAPAARNTGVAHALLHAMEAANAGRDIAFFVAPFNQPARKLYETAGYRDIGEYRFGFGVMHTMIKPAQAAR